jgi:hypothetical protein
MKIYRTSDGYTFYLQDDGRLSDSINIDESDMIYASLEDLFEDEEPNLIGETE